MQPSESQHTRRGGIALFVIVIVLLFWTFLWRPVASGATETISFTVEDGQGALTIAEDLKDAHLIRSKAVFVSWVFVRGWSDHLQAGTYLLSPDMSVPHIASLIASGQAVSDDVTVTIPEGLNVWDIDLVAAARLHLQPNLFSATYAHDEGHLFPDTYRLPKDATVADLGNAMTTAFAEKVHATPAQIIIASILEKEAKSAEDMALVSGIIAKRLALGMPLQIDATVAYGWCNRTAGHGRPCDVTKAPIATEAKIDGAYNTYARKGLPTGPISNPGLKALDAAMHPKTSQSLYYLSTKDGSKIIYSRTLDEHLQNRRDFLGF